MSNPRRILSWVGKTGDLPQQLGLALVLGLLSVLVLIVTADAYVAKKTETKLVDFDNGAFLYTGLLDLPPEESVQLLPIGLTGNWVASGQPLPRALVDLAAIANGDTIFVAGGTDFQGKLRREVYTSTMNLLSDLTPWQSAISLPEVRAGAGMAVYPIDEDTSMLYVVGGARSQNFDAANTIYRVLIDNATGHVGSWQLDSQTLPDALYYASVIQHGSALYVIGGFGGTTNPVAFNTVRYASINSDGSLNPFVATSPLIEPVSNEVVIVYEGVTTDTLYLIGGQDRYTSTFKVFFADFLPGGGLTAWKRSAGQLPRNLWGHAGVLLHGEIILTGGVVDAIEPSLGISSTVKAALVDTNNPSFRLYDWCLGVPPPTCTIGAWQSGALLPEVRALHGTATGHSKIYVMGGEDAAEHPKDTVFYGTVTGVGALYSPEGQYRSDVIDLGQPASLRRLEWGVTLGHPGEMGMSMQYRYAPPNMEWVHWSAPVSSMTGTNRIDLDPPPLNARYVQYQANFATSITNASPLLNWVEVYYEVGDPEVAVRKDTGDIVSVTLMSDLDYTIHYTNNGEWVAEKVVLTETLPENTVYAGGPEWQQIDATNVYTRWVGNVPPQGGGIITFSTQVVDNVPGRVDFITNAVEIGYPPMTDAFMQRIVDPKLDNNYFEFSNPFMPYAITITKDALPLPGQVVWGGKIITYTLTYSNLGWAASVNTYIVDLVPACATYVPGSISGPGTYYNNPPRVRWNLGTVKSGKKGQVKYAVIVNESCKAGTVLSNIATLYSNSGPPKTSNAVTHRVVEHTFKLLTSKDAIPPPGTIVTTGLTIAYTLRYTNAGSIPASQVVLTDIYDLNDSYTFVSADPPPSVVTNNVWYLGSLEPGDSGSIEVIVRLKDVLPSNWPVTNQAKVASPDGPPAYSPLVYHWAMNRPGIQLVDLTVGNLRALPANPKPGQAVTVCATISNTGTLDAADYFWVELYIKPRPSAPPVGPSDSNDGYCLNNCLETRYSYLSYVGRLDRGHSQEIQFNPVNSPPIFPTDGTYDVYVQVDVAFDDPHFSPYWGVYPEEYESNNIAHIIVTAGKPKVYLPAIFRKKP